MDHYEVARSQRDTMALINYWALWGNCEGAYKLLSKHPNVDVNSICPRLGQTPMCLACMAGNLEMVILLSRHGACIERRSSGGISPLHTACAFGNLLVVMYLLDHGAQLEARRNDEMTALHIASKNGHGEVAELLLQRGANATAKTKDGMTALYLACENDQLETVWLLVNRFPWLIMNR